MPKPSLLMFAPFRIDLNSERLWRGTEALRLTGKAFAVLQYLVQHPDVVVTKDALLEHIWPAASVSEAVITVCIRELRQTLGDNRKAPRFIETVHGRGYRFIAPVVAIGAADDAPLAASPRHLGMLIGREAELTQVHQCYARALSGERQILFITGEAGIGKTTLVEHVVEALEADGTLWIGQGQCIEHYGAGEAYLPMLEALGRLCRDPGGAQLVALLSQHAPSWLLQMPALLPTAAYEGLQRRASGATRPRMLRELAEAVETLTAECPLVIVLEDLHWSDYSTLEWLAFVARRREPARCLILGTYRPIEVLVQDHPLHAVQQELQRHGHCTTLPLPCLPATGVAAYLAGRLGGQQPPAELATFIHQRTDGNPLFMVTMVDAMVRQGVLTAARGPGHDGTGLADLVVDVPESLRQLIEQQLRQMSPEDRALLEAASVAGTEFSAAAVAAGVEQAEEAVEGQCAALAQRGQFVQARGAAEWPDGTVATRYGFIHTLYQEVLYDRIPAGRRLRLHQRIGLRQERGYGTHAPAIAAELAMHFVRGREAHRAAQYLFHAGRNAQRRSAHQEALDHLNQGLQQLTHLPDTPARAVQELALHLSLGATLMTTRGYAAPEVEQAYARSLELYRQVGDTPQLFSVLGGLSAFYFARGALQTAQELGERLLHLAQRLQDPMSLMLAHSSLGLTLCNRGDLVAARAHLEQAVALYDPMHYRAHIRVQDPGASSLGFLACILATLGYPDQALEKSRAALQMAREQAHPFSLAYALVMVAQLHQIRREGPAVQEMAETLMAIANEHGFPFLVTIGTILRGWALTAQGQGAAGIAQMRQGQAAYQAIGAGVAMPYYLAILAEAYGIQGQAEEGLAMIAEALALGDKTGEHLSEAELHRLKGELLLQQVRPDMRHVETCFQHALDVARRQQAKAPELRAAVSLGRLWQQQGKRQAAHALVQEVYGWFSEGFDTADLREARALLEDLA